MCYLDLGRIGIQPEGKVVVMSIGIRTGMETCPTDLLFETQTIASRISMGNHFQSMHVFRITAAQAEDEMKWIKLLLMIVFGVILFNFANKITFPELSILDKNGNKNQSEVEIDSAILLMMESYPIRVSLALRGELPTPCHELVWEVVGPNEKNIIEVTTYAESDEGTFCIQMLEPFEHTIPIGEFTDLDFRVRLNGEDV
jgi:hypothetical protein